MIGRTGYVIQHWVPGLGRWSTREYIYSTYGEANADCEASARSWPDNQYRVKPWSEAETMAEWGPKERDA